MKCAAEIGAARDVPAPLCQPKAHGPVKTISEADAKAALAGFGVPVPSAMTADNPCAAATAAESIGFLWL